MRRTERGHTYYLQHLDGDGETKLEFVKREGPGYPGNEGSHEGTNLQEVIRACIDRVMYLNNQIKCPENTATIKGLRDALWNLEFRAARRHHLRWRPNGVQTDIENIPTCITCGHIKCSHMKEA